MIKRLFHQALVLFLFLLFAIVFVSPVKFCTGINRLTTIHIPDCNDTPPLIPQNSHCSFPRLKLLSGLSWIPRFEDNLSLDELSDQYSFQSDAKAFIESLSIAGAKVLVESCKRPAERSYLMHWAYEIAYMGFNPLNIPEMKGVAIEWWHGDYDRSKTAAKQMCTAYQLVYEPLLDSNHTLGLAVDLHIAWSGVLTIAGADGTPFTISSTPRTGNNPELMRIASSYGLYKLPGDTVHFSYDGK